MPFKRLNLILFLGFSIFTVGCGQQSLEIQKELSSSEIDSNINDPGPETPDDPSTDDPPPDDPPTDDPPPDDPPPPSGFYEWGVRSQQRVMISGHSLTPFGNYLNHLASNQSQNHQWNQHNLLGSPIRVRVHYDSHSGFGGWTGRGESKTGQPIHFLNEVRNPQTIGAGNKYNALIITDRHDIFNVLNWEGTIPYLKLYADLFHESSKKSRLFLYHSWLDINKSNPSVWQNYETQAQKIWECSAAKVNLHFQNQNSQIRILNIPAGAALVDLTKKIIAGDIPGFSGTTSARLNLLFEDNVHTTAVGTYYLSILNYIALYGVKPAPTALPTGNLTLLNQASTLNSLINHAWNFLNSYYTGPSRQHTMAQCRSFGPDFCSALNEFNGYAYNNCIGGINYWFSTSMPEWFTLPN